GGGAASGGGGRGRDGSPVRGQGDPHVGSAARGAGAARALGRHRSRASGPLRGGGGGRINGSTERPLRGPVPGASARRGGGARRRGRPASGGASGQRRRVSRGQRPARPSDRWSRAGGGVARARALCARGRRAR